LSGCRA